MDIITLLLLGAAAMVFLLNARTHPVALGLLLWVLVPLLHAIAAVD